MRIGIVTAGGDAPGLNAAIRGLVRKARHLGWETIGFRDGYRGLIENDWILLNPAAVIGILPKGGTILGSSSRNPFKDDRGKERVLRTMREGEISALAVIGGGSALAVADRLNREAGVPLVGIPKTIDNDIAGTDFCFGFDTAVHVATEAIDRLQTTAASHHRVMVVEVMGGRAGWIALYAGIAGGADVILIPEEPFDLDEICSTLQKRYDMGRTFSIVVVGEGAVPAGGREIADHEGTDDLGTKRLGGIGRYLADRIEGATGFETRVSVLGHIMRGGTPTVFDRMLASRFAVAAIEFINEEKWGMMTGLSGVRVLPVPIEDAVREPRLVPPAFYEKLKVFCG